MKREKELEGLIRHHKICYYQGNPEISDAEYDRLEDELRAINPDNSVLQMIGSVTLGENKVRHKKKMLSLNKTYQLDELKNWAGANEVVSCYKIDGVSCSLVYEKGILRLAKTRGDGVEGENITAKVRWMDCVPQEVDNFKKYSQVEIRGELFCDAKSFFLLAEEMEQRGLARPTSQRNIVAGLVSRKENLELSRHIRFKGYDYINDEDGVKTEMSKMDVLKKGGFDVLEMILHQDNSTLSQAIEDAQHFMEEGEYQIDGLVFSYNLLSLHEELGETVHHPRYKMAFKFAGEAKITTIKEIVWSVSRNGILTPVALVEPVELSGAIISRVTLHNYGMVKNYQLKSGDQIEIIRSGEVIPKFLSVTKSSDRNWEVPAVCPTCGAKVEIEEIRLFCSNAKCPGRISEGILNFVQKIGIAEISFKRLDEMIRAGLVRNIPDLYRLQIKDFLSLEKVQDKLAQKFFEEIQKSKKTSLATFLSALGISGGAFNKCEKVVRNGFNTIDKIKTLSLAGLMEIESFAEKSAQEFLNSLQEKHTLIDELLEIGFVFEENTQHATIISGKKICITGALSEKRATIEEWIREGGGIIVASVSSNTDYLLTNESESTSSKYKKARALGTKIISENDLKKMLQLG